MPKRAWPGLQKARAAGGTTGLYWRSSIELTLSEADAVRLKAMVDTSGLSYVTLVRHALIDWLNRVDAGQAPIPKKFARLSKTE